MVWKPSVDSVSKRRAILKNHGLGIKKKKKINTLEYDIKEVKYYTPVNWKEQHDNQPSSSKYASTQAELYTLLKGQET